MQAITEKNTMYVPHVVVIEARTLPPLSDVLYQKTVEALDHGHIGHSRVSVPTLLGAPLAMRTVIEATRGAAALSGSDWRRPDGYIVIGTLIESLDPYPETTYREIVRSIQDLACYYTIPVGYVIIFNRDVNIQESQIKHAVEGVQNCMNLMELKRHMGLTPGAILTP